MIVILPDYRELRTTGQAPCRRRMIKTVSGRTAFCRIGLLIYKDRHCIVGRVERLRGCPPARYFSGLFPRCVGVKVCFGI